MGRGPARSPYGELRMVNEYLAAQYPNDPSATRVRLGSIDPQAGDDALTTDELAMVGVFRRWADYMVFGKTEVVLGEAKLRSAPGAVGQLMLYKTLVPHTPELAGYLKTPLQLELVVAIDDPATRRLAEGLGIRVVVYRPDWYVLWLQTLRPRETRATRDLGSMAPAAAEAG